MRFFVTIFAATIAIASVVSAAPQGGPGQVGSSKGPGAAQSGPGAAKGASAKGAGGGFSADGSAGGSAGGKPSM